MTNFTQEWIDAQNAKRMPKVSIPERGDDSLESMLHDKITQHCKMKGWYFVHSRMDRAATNQIGVPDFIIATRTGTLWIEAKRKGAKPRPEQLAANHWLKTLGHKAHFVWSFEEFLEFSKGEK